jgi:DNA-binding NtrC family response regulator
MRPPIQTRRVQLAGKSATEIELRGFVVEVTAGPDSGEKLRTAQPTFRVGTAPENDLVLTDTSVSGRHCELVLTETGAAVEDLGSTNGTWVNGVRVPRAEFTDEVELRLGETTLKVREGTETRHAIPSDEDRLGPLVGSSAAIAELFGLIRALATTPASVLIHGESGTGKELVAQAIHELSGRKGPLVVFDAAASDPQMIRGDLFGHKKGAYTGADSERPGAFRAADGGTLFIDELGELPLDMQPRLLRALESRKVTPMGEDLPVPVDVRVIAATHRDLQAMVREGTFREDLYHRLAVVPLRVPALRERPGDIPMLIGHFSEQLGLRCELAPAAIDAMARHPWPGNVRALRNHLERLSATRPGATLDVPDLDLPEVEPELLVDAHQDPERALVEAALARNRGNKTAAARELGMSLSTLKRRLKEWADEEA